jgi:hypothetical protein
MKESAPTEKDIRREQFESDFRWFMGDARGRRLMLRLLSDIGLYRCSYDPGLQNATTEMLFREGMKNVGYRLVSDINRVCPEKYHLMLKEGTNGRRTDSRRPRLKRRPQTPQRLLLRKYPRRNRRRTKSPRRRQTRRRKKSRKTTATSPTRRAWRSPRRTCRNLRRWRRSSASRKIGLRSF